MRTRPLRWEGHLVRTTQPTSCLVALSVKVFWFCEYSSYLQQARLKQQQHKGGGGAHRKVSAVSVLSTR